MGTNSRLPQMVSKAVSEELRVVRARGESETVRSLAERSGVPYSTLHKTLAGERMIDVEELHKIAVALNTSGSAVLRAVEDRLAAESSNVSVLPATKTRRVGVQQATAARKDDKRES